MYRVMFLCTGNIYRSPYAEAIANSWQLPGVEFSSAGVRAVVGQSMDPVMASQLSVSRLTTDHRAIQLTRALLAEADLVISMGSSERGYVFDEWPEYAKKVFVIGQVARELAKLPDDLKLKDLTQYLWDHRSLASDDSIPDPCRKDARAVALAARMIDQRLAVIMEVLKKLAAQELENQSS